MRRKKFFQTATFFSMFMQWQTQFKITFPALRASFWSKNSLSQSRSHGFLVWSGRTRLARSCFALGARTIALRAHCCATRSKARLVSKSSLKIMAQAPPLDPPLYSLGWVMRYTISLVVKLNEDLNFLLCCAIDVGESVNLFTSRF